MNYDFVRVPFNASQIPDNDIEGFRVDREQELSNIVHLTTQINENVLLTGDRGQGKSFLTILVYNYLLKNHPDILPVRVNLTSLYFYKDEDSFIRYFPALVLDQLCKEVWVTLLRKDYSALLNSYDAPDKIKLFKNKAEQKLLEIHSIVRKEEYKLKRDSSTLIGGTLGLKGEVGDSQQLEWKNRELQSFELLELTREIKNTILKQHSKKKILLICDEANKLTEGEQYHILQNYLDFFGANQFNFLLVVSNFNKLKTTAEKSGLFKIIELGGFKNPKLVKELICKSFYTEKLKIENRVYDLIFEAFSGHLRFTNSVFAECLERLPEGNSEVTTQLIESTIVELKLKIAHWEKINQQIMP